MSKLVILTGMKAQVSARASELEEAGFEFRVLLRRGPFSKLQAEKLNGNEQGWKAEGEEAYTLVLEIL